MKKKTPWRLTKCHRHKLIMQSLHSIFPHFDQILTAIQSLSQRLNGLENKARSAPDHGKQKRGATDETSAKRRKIIPGPGTAMVLSDDEDQHKTNSELTVTAVSDPMNYWQTVRGKTGVLHHRTMTISIQS